MISLQEVERIASTWARRESLRRGYPRTPMVSEFDVGYVVWTREPSDRLPRTGDSVTTVIDKETGRTSTWPSLPSAVVKDLYRRRRPDLVGATSTVDPAVALRHGALRRPTPTVAAHLTVRYQQHHALGAKGDQHLQHHPLVRAYLRELPAGERVRGADRHAELIVLSDLLHRADDGRADDGPLTEADARELLAEAHLELFHVREAGDPAGGTAAAPCATCGRALVHFGVLPWTRPADRAPADAPAGGLPGDRFPPPVAAALAGAGWAPGREPHYARAERLVGEVCAVVGQEYRHAAFPAAVRALAEFADLRTRAAHAGTRHWVRPLHVDPLAAAHTADILAETAAAVGARLFPLGVEGAGEALLAIDDAGRVFALDQGGEWFLGGTLDAALGTLLGSGPPAARVRDDGGWTPDP
ncbi:hypothetical protein GCM10010124_05020 [Pilimelia terevasa]|uniref:YwqJ-like deaminase n=1 Tax=Pilimelia terevasa TaxID=53372 RepID=A0A8J3BEE3_9ACTN|nr:SUKH-3 domain-containing protein [Pilimelia terevasa]GGK15342.1 hypothetical protein GCM10010124_05020 [Pilimelia terevasa]